MFPLAWSRRGLPEQKDLGMGRVGKGFQVGEPSYQSQEDGTFHHMCSGNKARFCFLHSFLT